MVLSAKQKDRIFENLTAESAHNIANILQSMDLPKSKQERQDAYNEINQLIIDYAISKDNPTILQGLIELPENKQKEIFSQILQHYLRTANPQWFLSILENSEKIPRKSEQSELLSITIENVILEGIKNSKSSFIKQGLSALNRINFKKYRSDTVTNILPEITRYAIRTNDEHLLFEGFVLINEITDVSKKAIVHADLAQALANIAIHKNNHDLYIASLLQAAKIHQKLRRKTCIEEIVKLGASSEFREEILDLETVIHNFEDLPEEVLINIVESVVEQILDKLPDKKPVLEKLHRVCKNKPALAGVMIQSLLENAERSADFSLLTDAMTFLPALPGPEAYPVKDIIHTGMAVARESQDTKGLYSLLPFIEKNCKPDEIDKTYLLFAQIMLANGNFENALQIFGKINRPSEIGSLYSESLAKLINEAIIRDSPDILKKLDLEHEGATITAQAISRAVKELYTNAAFPQIINHMDAINRIILRHPDKDNLFLETITNLISRDFLEVWDSALLVNIAKLITDSTIRERALSTIVMKIAEVGVKNKNRDFLQRAVGITCLIEGQDTRSLTLSHIIDNAAILAAEQGDLDLLLRMHSWSGSLLDKGMVPYATKNIIDGMIKYALDKQSLEALDEAYQITKNTDDPALKMQLCERIAECFVRIGCVRISHMSLQEYTSQVDYLLEPFENGLDILNQEMNRTQVSLKIAGMIDIILSAAKNSSSSGYILPLAKFSIEIENPLERNAMMMRIVAHIHEELAHPDTADPYEIVAYILQTTYQDHATPTIIDLVYRILNHIADPFVKLNGYCTLADSAIRINDRKRAYSLLEETFRSAQKLQAEYQRIIIFAGLAREFRHIDPQMARICLDAGLKRLSMVEKPMNAMARHHMVLAIVSMKGILPEEERAVLVLQVLEKISDPKEYINALISAYAIVREDARQCKSIVGYIIEALEKIESPYDKALLILDVIPLSVRSCSEETSLGLIRTAEELSDQINIQHIADTIRDTIAGILVDLSKKQQHAGYLKKAVDILLKLDDDELKSYRLNQIGYQQDASSSAYVKIFSAASTVIQDGSVPGQVITLERSVRLIADRAKKTQYFCKLSILFRDTGDLKTSKRMLNNAIKESSIIRPLSKRAYVRCDMAMKMYSAGYEVIAQDLIDFAMDAATNIRQSVLRDTVFNELGLAIRIMQGMRD